MSDTREIIELLKEIRDFQKERLLLERKSIQDRQEAQAAVQTSLKIQRTASRVQKIALIGFVAIVFWMALQLYS